MNARVLKGFVCTLLLLGKSTGSAQEEPPFQPEIHPLERYQRIWERSPFVVETKIVEESAWLAQRFALTGMAMIDGAPVAFLLDRNSLARIIVAPDRAPQGIELVSVDQQPDARNSSAVIKLGAEQASLRFDAESLHGTAGAAAVPTGAVPDPATGGVIPANAPGIQPTVSPGQPPNSPTRVIRRTLIRPRQ
jgi:hypothetical protein